MEEFQAKIKACQYNTVYVIGNGFDLSAGLQSSYGDFIKSELFRSLDSGLQTKPKLINFDEIKENALAEYLDTKHNIQGWVDAELELKLYISKSRKIKPSETLEKEYKEIVSALTNYLTRQLEENKDIGRLLPEQAGYKLLSKHNFTAPAIALNFNYTNIFENFASTVRKEKNAPENAIKVVNVHGTLQNDNIIFGVEDTNDIPDGYIFLLKSANAKYKIDPEFKMGGKSISKVLAKANNIIFFGYSLGVTDHSYFKDFFWNDPEGYNIEIYYHTEQARRDIICRLRELTNCKLVELFSKNKVDFKHTGTLSKT